MNKKQKEDLIKKLQEGYNIKGDFELTPPTIEKLMKIIEEQKKEIEKLENAIQRVLNRDNPWWKETSPTIGDIKWYPNNIITPFVKMDTTLPEFKITVGSSDDE